MQSFDYRPPTRTIFGKVVVEQLPQVMAQPGKRVLLTYGGGSIKKIGYGGPGKIYHYSQPVIKNSLPIAS